MNGDIFKTILIAIIGGISVYYIPKMVHYFILRKSPILIYQLDDNGTDKGVRRVHHSFGKMIEDKHTSNGRAWEHTNERINNGLATCYGPYSKEIPFSGKYKARFRIKVENIKNKNASIVILDVTHGERQPNGNLVMLGLPLVEKNIKGHEFTDGKYKNFDVEFEYDGQSLVEFRCTIEHAQNYKNNIDRILFDNVKIFPVISPW